MPDDGGQVLLRATGLTVSFGGVRAVDDVDLAVRQGSLVGLIGPNGAGKTTTIDALTGFVPHRGRVEVDGRSLDRLGPHRRAAAGLARTWQSLELFDDLTVLENCRVAADRPSLRAFLADLVRPERPRDEADLWWALDLLGLTDLADARPTDLPLGHRKLAAVARALAARPRLVLLDEPAAGLDSEESLVLGERLRHILDHGISVFLVDHDMGLVLGVCDELYVLDFGRVIAHGTPAQIRADARVIEAYLGETHGTGGTSPSSVVGPSASPGVVPEGRG